MLQFLPLWKLAAGGVVLVVLAGGAWKLRHSGVVDGRAEVRAEWTAATLTASETARLREQAAQKANERIDREYQTSKTKLADDKRATDDSLRVLQAAIKQPGSVASTSSGDYADPRSDIIAECAGTAVILDEAVKRMASKTAALQQFIGEVCLKSEKATLQQPFRPKPEPSE